MRTFDGYKKRSLDSKKVLLADGSHTDVVIGKIEWDSENRTLKWTKVGDTTSTSVLFGSNAFTSDTHNYLSLSGGTLALGEGLKFHADNNYFGENLDARIISLLDWNGTVCDGGLIIDERATSGGKEYVTELLRIRDGEFKWKGTNISLEGHTHKYASSQSAGGPADYVRWEKGTSNANRRIPFAWEDNVETTNARVRLVYNDSFLYNPATDVLTVGSITGSASSATYAGALYASNFNVKTGSGNLNISIGTFLTWMVITNKYIPANTYCHKVFRTGWSYAGNDNLEVSSGTYIGLEGSTIEFTGYIYTASGATSVDLTSTDSHNFEIRFITAPTVSGTSYPNTVWIYRNNGKTYSPGFTRMANYANLSAYLPLSGGKMTGPLTWTDNKALPEDTAGNYFLTIDSFADGGTTKWISKANAKIALELLNVANQGANYYTLVYNSANIGDSSAVTFTNLAAKGNSSVGMIYAATDNPRGAAGWCHCWSQAWTSGTTSSWVSQIALGTNYTGGGMWYRTTSGNIAGLAWKRVLDSSNYSSYALPLSGGTLTGVLNLASSLYEDSYSGALNCNNSNIYGVNGIYTSDNAENAAEGINFWRSTTTVDSIWASKGTFYFTPNRTLGTAGTNYTIWHSGNDGSGSGLDADLLDGYHETAFPRLVGTKTTFNWNDLVRAGYYKIQNSSIQENGPAGSYPFGMAVIVTTENHADGENRELQLYFPHSIASSGNKALFLRMHNSSTLGSGWGSWVGIPTFDSVLPLTGGTLTGLLTLNNGGKQASGIKFYSGAYLGAHNNSNGEVILTSGHLRFSDASNWDYNYWAGLKYTHSSKIVYLGISDGTVFTANSALSGGKLYTPGISNIYIGNGTYTVYHTGNKPTYNFNDISDAPEIYLNSGTVVRRVFLTRTKNSNGYRSRACLGLTNPASQFSPVILSVGTNDAGTTFRDFTFHPNGNLNIDGSFYTNSDERYKNVQSYLTNLLEDLASIPIFTYYWNDNKHDDKLHVGSSALAAGKVIPELVNYDKTKDFYNLDYATLGTIAGITACKELVSQKSELQQLKKRVIELENELKSLKK